MAERSRTPILVALAILLSPPAALAGGLQLQFDLPAGSFAAIRFQLAPESDLDAEGALVTCPSADRTPPQAFGTAGIRDGASYLGALAVGGGHGLWPDGRLVEIGAAGHTLAAPAPPEPHAPPLLYYTPSGCGIVHGYAYGSQASPPTLRDRTLIFWAAPTDATLFVNASWTRGVLGVDTITGSAIALKPHEFEHGAGLGATPGAVAGANAGALLAQRLSPTRDLVGYWWPFVGPHAGSAHCHRDGVACEGDGLQMLASKGPTEWSFGYDARVERGAPHYALVALELPDAGYLAP